MTDTTEKDIDILNMHWSKFHNYLIDRISYGYDGNVEKFISTFVKLGIWKPYINQQPYSVDDSESRTISDLAFDIQAYRFSHAYDTVTK